MKRTGLLKKIFLAASTALFCSMPLCAQFNALKVPDSSAIRKTVLSSWLKAPLNEIKYKAVENRTNESGSQFQISLEQSQNEFNVVIAPKVVIDVEQIKENKKHIVSMEIYPSGAAGSWILSRDLKTGKPSRIRCFFNNDSEVYIQLRPDGTKTLADLIVFNSFAARSVPIGIPFENLYTASFSQLYQWTKDRLPWKKVTVTTGLYREKLQMVAVIRENLKNINYAQYACYDENGKLSSIITGDAFEGQTYILDDYGNLTGEETNVKDDYRLTLSSPGFVKWIADGLIEPLTGSGTKINELLENTYSFSPTGKAGVLSQSYNLTLTLDWCRNLAAKVMSARSSRDFSYKTGGVDVRVEPFACEIVNSKIVSAPGYLTGSGYEIKSIKSLLYVLGVTEPGYFYLAAIKRTSSVKPDEMAFNDCAALFPYFDDKGTFGCIVFDNGTELTLETFIAKYASSFAHLERIKASDYFFPKN